MCAKVTSYVLVVTEVGKEHEVVQALQKIEGVTLAQTVYGEFDVMTRVDRESLQELDSAITKIRKINGIIRTMTLISG
jgi:DNA-binding Lrp family transcriptional regulator